MEKDNILDRNGWRLGDADLERYYETSFDKQRDEWVRKGTAQEGGVIQAVGRTNNFLQRTYST